MMSRWSLSSFYPIQVTLGYTVFLLLVYSSTLKTAEAQYYRDDSPELYNNDDRDSSPEQGYGYGCYNNYNGYNGYGGYNSYNGYNGYGGYGANSDIDDVSLELSRHQLQPQGLCDVSIAASSFTRKYLCADCITNQDAEKKMNWPGFATASLGPYILFADKTFGGKAPISYIDIDRDSADKCKIKERVQVWSCKRKTPDKPWTCTQMGFCTDEIKMVGGVYKPDGKPDCHKVHPNKIWDDKDCPTLSSGVVNPDTTASCMLECKRSLDADTTKAKGCNAFNYKPGAGALCTLKRCSSPYPAPTPNTDNYGAYYQDVVL